MKYYGWKMFVIAFLVIAYLSVDVVSIILQNKHSRYVVDLQPHRKPRQPS